MPGSKVIIHKGKGESHTVFTAHLCLHCMTQHHCSTENGHTGTEECPLPPEFTCPECETKIFRGDFSFGTKFDDCHEDCTPDTKRKYFKHARKCSHHYEAIIDEAIKRAEANG